MTNDLVDILKDYPGCHVILNVELPKAVGITVRFGDVSISKEHIAMFGETLPGFVTEDFSNYLRSLLDKVTHIAGE